MDVGTGEMPPELVPPVPPAPEATAEVETAPGHAADAPPPSTAARSTNVEDGSGNTNDDNDARDETSTNVESAAAPAAERALPEIEYPIGPLRQAVLDHLADTEGPQSVAQIIASMPAGTTRGSGESAIRREWEADRIERVGAGLYVLAKPKSPKQARSPKSTPQPSPAEDEAIWFSALERWAVDPSSWDVEKLGPPPDQPNNIPAEIKLRFNDRRRKREERRREAEAAAARQSAADAELRARLIHATGGNFQPGPGIDDVSPIQLAMQLVPLERILSAIRNKTDKKMYPGNAPATSWREDRLLQEIAESYCRSDILPRLVDAWSKAGRAPAVQNSPPTGEMPDDNIDRNCHDQENAPSGPHVMPQPPMDEDAGAAPSVAPDVSANAADASDAPPAVSAPLES